jgi:hypothetical protein
VTEDPATEPEPGSAPAREGRAIDPERLIYIAVIVFFIKAVGFVVAAVLAQVNAHPLGDRVAPALLAAGTVVAGAGLLKWQRWAWPLALLVLILDATLVGGIVRLLIDLALLLLLVRPQVRARFGMAERRGPRGRPEGGGPAAG